MLTTAALSARPARHGSGAADPDRCADRLRWYLDRAAAEEARRPPRPPRRPTPPSPRPAPRYPASLEPHQSTSPTPSSPTNTVVTAPTSTGGGPGQFTVKEYYGCAPNTDVSLTVQTGKGPEPFMHLQEFYGWAPSATFPNDGEVQTACAANSCLDFGQEHSRFLSVTNATALPNSLVTFRLRVTTAPAAPSCDSNFTNSPLKGYQLTAAFNAPLPPLTLGAPDDASGGLRGEDLCGPGTVASITAFMNKALPAAGWTKGSRLEVLLQRAVLDQRRRRHLVAGHRPQALDDRLPPEHLGANLTP